jgi:Uma2 family endonuclease
MAVQPAEKIHTAEDYFALTEEYPRHELLEGELIEMTPAPTSTCQRISWNLLILLDAHCQARKSGEVLAAPMDVVLSPRTVVQPDLIFIAPARRAQLVKEHIAGAPDLVIEILSPAAGARDLNQKRKLYARHGVHEYWVVDPDDESIEIQRLQGSVFSTLAIFEKGQSLTSPTFEGLTVDVAQVFSD